MAAVAAYILELRRLLPECEDVKKNVQSEMLFTSEVSHGFARLLNRLQQNVPFFLMGAENGRIPRYKPVRR